MVEVKALPASGASECIFQLSAGGVNGRVKDIESFSDTETPAEFRQIFDEISRIQSNIRLH